MEEGRKRKKRRPQGRKEAPRMKSLRLALSKLGPGVNFRWPKQQESADATTADAGDDVSPPDDGQQALSSPTRRGDGSWDYAPGEESAALEALEAVDEDIKPALPLPLDAGGHRISQWELVILSSDDEAGGSSGLSSLRRRLRQVRRRRTVHQVAVKHTKPRTRDLCVKKPPPPKSPSTDGSEGG
jgi:hypothetical protein